MTVDTVPPAAPGDVVCFADPTTGVVCGGSGEAHAEVSVRDGNGVPICSATVQADGSWACRSAGGALPATVTQTDPSGKVSPTVLLPTQPAQITCVKGDNDTVTRNGISTASAVITVFDASGAAVCSARANGDGAWSCESETPVTDTPLTVLHMADGHTIGRHGVELSDAPILTPDPAPAPVPSTLPTATHPVADLAAAGRSTDTTGAAWAGAAVIALGSVLLCIRLRRRVES
ncbi:Ig-like domain-containing protein [Leifsonia sp. McL0607]|uniref:Ig-like domain-containing protein n=1 Tax=Leifsonia sp. McL0607 TaxID=3415672 RepID=UPI003CFB2FC5